MADSIIDELIGNNGGDQGEERVSVAKSEPLIRGGLVTLPGSVAAMLDFRLKDGTRTALPYGYLSMLTLVPDAGLTLTFSDRVVSISGRNLAAVYTAITNQTALAVVESRTGYDEGADEPYVESIDIAGAEKEPG